MLKKGERVKEVRWLSVADSEESKVLLQKIEKEQAPILLVYRNDEKSDVYWAVMHEKYNVDHMDGWIYVLDCKEHNGVLYMTLSSKSIHIAVSRVMRRLCVPPVEVDLSLETPVEDGEASDAWMDIFEAPAEPEIPAEQRFLMEYTPATIAALLDEEVIGQKELTAAAADFLYYHVLRQLHPELPQRPLLITGPSGSGKTEVWRVIEKRFGDFVKIRIMDGSNLSCEGWSGNYKLESYIDSTLAKGGILVVDEFDKLTRPKFSSGGANVSKDMQAEFLKLMEGEYRISHNKRLTGDTSKMMGLVLVGAFEELRNAPEEMQQARVAPIGFGLSDQADKPADQHRVTDETLIAYGVMPEIVGRIAVKCETQYLSDEMYMRIILNPMSRVTVLKQVLQSCGADVEQLLSTEKIKELIATSRNNRTGVRWVASQVESQLLAGIREQGLYHTEPERPRNQPIPA